MAGADAFGVLPRPGTEGPAARGRGHGS